MASVPNAGDRNQLVWNAWEMANPSTERYTAQQRFGKYRFLPNVCHFAEHTTMTNSGPLSVDANGLRSICKNLNRRIRESGLYPALINKHTSEGPVTAESEPTIVGYAASYRLGMIGDKDQKFAIFGDEFHAPNAIAEVNRKPRRSVELIRYRDSTRNYFDPVACLGAESPRIEIPPAYYSAGHDADGEVVRYSVVAPVHAGASNTYIPKFDSDTETERNQAVPVQQTEPSMLSPEDVMQLVDAVKNALAPDLEFLNTLRSQGSQMAPGANPAAPAIPAQGDQLALGGDPSQAAQAPVAAAPSGPTPGSDPTKFGAMQNQPTRYSVEDDFEMEDIERYSALEEKCEKLTSEYMGLVERYAAQNVRLGNLERERTDAIRSHRLRELSHKYPVVDFDEEASRVLYSAGAEMDDDDFETYVDTIVRYAADSTPPTQMIPDGEAYQEDKPVKERYSQKFQQEVVKRITSASARGETLGYEETERELAKEWGIS